jgi:peptidyl-prolyl cis-trans isomerase D
MLDKFREGAQSKFAKVILALFAIPFALWGVESYTNNSGSSDAVATVAGQKISAQEYNQAVKQMLDQWRTRLGGNVDTSVIDTPEFRRSVLEGLIKQRLLLADAVKSRSTVTDKELAEQIAAIPAFQDDGKFSKVRYELLLRQQGLTPLSFEERVRQDIVVQRYQEFIAGTPIISNASIDALIRASEQAREVSVISYTPEQFAGQVKIDDAAIKSYYDAHKQDFTIPDQVKVEYLVLSPAELMGQMEVSEEEIKKQYEALAAKYVQPEERQASHILIKAAADASEADKKAALAKAEDLLKQAKAEPGKFAALASKFSEDPGSASKGGDLGFFRNGAMVKAFDEAVFQMKKDEIRGPVQSEFGYHIIKLADIKPSKGKSLDEVRGEITAELKKQKAGKKFTEIAESFSNTVYEQSASLKPAADAYKLSIKQSDWITRKGGEAAPELNNEKLLQAVFGEEVLKNKRNTEAVEVAPSTLVAARVAEFKPSALRPLAEVSAGIKDMLLREEANKLAIKQGKDHLAEINKGAVPATLKWPDAQLVSRQQPGALIRPELEAVFKTPTKTLPAYTGVESPQGGYKIIRVSKVTDGAPSDEAKKQAYRDELKTRTGQREFSAMVDSLRNSAEVKVRMEALEKKEQ